VSIKKAPTNSSEPNVISINPFRCRVWAEHGRLEEWVTEKSCEAELKSIAAHGQITPVLVRRVTDDPSYDFELICGTRRLFVTRFLNLALLRISPELIFLGTACACVLGLIGGLPPALRAGRQPIATALQGG